jgi:hypothetical protein
VGHVRGSGQLGSAAGPRVRRRHRPGGGGLPHQQANWTGARTPDRRAAPDGSDAFGPVCVGTAHRSRASRRGWAPGRPCVCLTAPRTSRTWFAELGLEPRTRAAAGGLLLTRPGRMSGTAAAAAPLGRGAARGPHAPRRCNQRADGTRLFRPPPRRPPTPTAADGPVR